MVLFTKGKRTIAFMRGKNKFGGCISKPADRDAIDQKNKNTPTSVLIKNEIFL